MALCNYGWPSNKGNTSLILGDASQAFNEAIGHGHNSTTEIFSGTGGQIKGQAFV